MDVTRFETLNVRTEDEGRIAVVELDHGRANEMGSAQIAEWEALTEQLETSSVRVLITYSSKRTKKGTAVFIAGANVTERAEWTSDQVKAHVRRQRTALARLRQAPVFHIAVVEGVALGWGTEFLLCADYRIACPSSKFGLPETGLGIVPGAGGTSELWALVGVSEALRLGMTGETLDAEEARRVGLVQETAEGNEAGLLRARKLAEQVARRSPTAVAAFKRGVLASVGLSSEERREIEARAYELCVDRGEAARGRAAFKEILAGGDVDWGDKVAFEP